MKLLRPSLVTSHTMHSSRLKESLSQEKVLNNSIAIQGQHKLSSSWANSDGLDLNYSTSQIFISCNIHNTTAPQLTQLMGKITEIMLRCFKFFCELILDPCPMMQMLR